MKFDHKAFIKTLTHKPGVYQMRDSNNAVIYVGKAKNLRKRVASYFNRSGHSPKTRAMVDQINDITVTVTHTENEALLLENNLIKSLKPKYNIWFRDDKSYPYIYLASEHDFPRLSYYRGARKGKGNYFGPYPSAGAVRQTLNLIQKLFLIRSCEDSFYAHRKRPCLQYQIKRCSAPCVDLIAKDDYARDIKHAVMFLEGRNEQVLAELLEPMQQAADNLEYERAAQFRDQIVNLRKLQEHQNISAGQGDIDVIACVKKDQSACIQLFSIRNGINLGNKSWHPLHTREAEPSEVIEAFISQHYLDERIPKKIPHELIVSHPLKSVQLLSGVLSKKLGQKVRIKSRVRGPRARWLNMARENAEISLQQMLSRQSNQQTQLQQLASVLKLDEPVERIECFDISHTSGEATVGACVVYGVNGAVRSDFRRFNIRDITPGNDYGAMFQAMFRRYSRVKKEDGKLPDLILIDGGKGQLSMAERVMEELQLQDILLVGIAKGPSRKPGMETLLVSGNNGPLKLPADSAVLHLLQYIRDEAHRFAITGHTGKRRKSGLKSTLEEIDGIGNKRRQNLIKYFGGLQGINRAGVDDLSMVPGISKNLAQKIYDTLHGT